MAVDLFKFPDLATARRGDPHATLDGTLGGKAPSRKADLRSTVAKVDAGVVQSLISAIVPLVAEIGGRPLSTIIPVNPGAHTLRISVGNLEPRGQAP